MRSVLVSALSISTALGFPRLDRAGDLLVSGGPQRVLFAAILIRIGFRGYVFAGCALALLERVGIGFHRCFLTGFDGVVFVRSSDAFSSDALALLRNAS